jgi:L-serine dehydratase
MRAANAFAREALERGTPTALTCDLYGSLALTGRGHATDKAVLAGLAGWLPETVEPEAMAAMVETVVATGRLDLAGRVPVPFQPAAALVFRTGEFLKEHANALRFTASYGDGQSIVRTYYSIGGGAIAVKGEALRRSNAAVPYPFHSAAELLATGAAQGLSIAEVMWANETAWRSRAETEAFIDRVHDAMLACIARGCQTDGILPGGLKVSRRAKHLHEKLLARGPRSDPSLVFEWVSLYALAVNEENAAGGRIVTAPTNGAAGVLPAVLKYYEVFVPTATGEGAKTFLMTASAIGFLYKARASISGAEMGCQGEVGVACSMAAAGLVAALGGSNAQIENAAEIGMEHNLGLTCDPIKGLVQIPCIERNTMGAVKAINAAYLALQGDGRHVVSLDAVIETMRQTGNDMRTKYKETALGGLAVNVVEC